MHLIEKSLAIISLALVVCGIASTQQKNAATSAIAGFAWTQSCDAGYTDDRGTYAGGSEIMHLVGHKGRFYAANGYWEDSRWKGRPYADRQSAQVLRLDSADGRWQVDLDMGKSNGHGLAYMKGNILKSVTFTRNGSGKLMTHSRRRYAGTRRWNFPQAARSALGRWVSSRPMAHCCFRLAA